ncbi:MAG: methyltransferase domain-containing protein [Verrucomicrobiaceae bacterium]|nr:methyltransferase domain-containing protein [Verrucomicrobiaceae bacterium]
MNEKPDAAAGTGNPWEDRYRAGDVFWDRGHASPPLMQYVARHPLSGRVLVPGCGRGNDVAALAKAGVDVLGVDIAPTAIREARERYPDVADRFVTGDLFDLAPALRGAFDVVMEHTCLSGMEPALREKYRRGVESALKPGGLIVGVWFINPALDPGSSGPPYPLSVPDLDALFADGFEVLDDYVPDVAFEGREGRERLRVLRRTRSS